MQFGLGLVQVRQRDKLDRRRTKAKKKKKTASKRQRATKRRNEQRERRRRKEVNKINEKWTRREKKRKRKETLVIQWVWFGLVVNRTQMCEWCIWEQGARIGTNSRNCRMSNTENRQGWMDAYETNKAQGGLERKWRRGIDES